MELYLIRHGQSEANAKKMHAGWAPVHLTELGREQAKLTGHLVSHLVFDMVIVSDLERAQETAAIALPGYSFHLDSRIREYNVGKLSNRLIEDCHKEWGQSYVEACKCNDFARFGGENIDMVSNRIASFMKEMEDLEREDLGNGRIAVVCHEGSIRHMLFYVLGCRFSPKSLRIDNCSVTRLSCDQGQWSLCSCNYTGSPEGIEQLQHQIPQPSGIV